MAADELDYTDRLSFIAEWYDYERSLLKNFYLHYYPFDNSVELFDKDRNRVYLRRAVCDGVLLKDMFVGNTVRIYGRQMNITDYADARTRKLTAKKNEKTLAVFKPTVFKEIGPIITCLTARKFKITRLKMATLNQSEAIEFYESKKSDSFLPFMIEQIVSGPIVIAELVGEDAIAKWRALLGPKDPAVARKEAPDSLRAIYGRELASNGFHGPETEEEATREISFFFPKQHGDTRRTVGNIGKFKNSTCCVIKPHAIESGCLGDIITEITNTGFSISAMEMFYLSNANADEFLEVYKGIVTDFSALMLSFIDGPCVALEISSASDSANVHGEFRKFVGPFDPEIARQIRPNTMRAKFGIDKYRNALHCTDLAEDTNLELEYFFKILQN
ncbi:nmdyn-D7 [Carabus blaptoides fortunei]